MGKHFRLGSARRTRLAAIALFALAFATPISSWAVVDHIFTDGFERFWKVSLADVQIAATDNSVWSDLKDLCDTDLNSVINDIYAGFDWRQAAQDYGLCYAAGGLRGDPKAPTYSKKAVAMLKTLARTFPVIADNQNHQFLAFGDGTTKKFTLPMTPLSGTNVHVFSNTAVTHSFTYSGTTQIGVTPEFDSDHLYPVLRISDTLTGATSNGALEYTPEVDFHVSMRDDVNGNTNFNVLHWIGSKHPALTHTYHVATNMSADDAEIMSGFTVSGTNLTFTTAPAVGTSLFVEYVGSDYTQTSNFAGGVESVKPDGPGYNMRAMNVGLAYGYDTVRQSPDMTAALRQEFYTVLNGQLDWFTADGYEGPNLCDHLCGTGNYFIRGYLTGAMFTAYATDSDNPRALPGGDLKPLANTLLIQTFNAVKTHLPGGYGPQGTYSEGTNQDILQIFDLWKQLTTLDGAPQDLAPQLEWTDNLVPATIHGTKPDRVTFYDGGDWNDLPATPLTESMTAFIKYLPNHPMAPFARQFLSDYGSPVSGTKTDYKTGAGTFPLSYLAKFTGPMYARSDWTTSAVWVSLADGPIFEDHQHLDQGHFTLQRGADYLLIDSGGYNIYHTLPSHNTLGFDDQGAGDHIVYPPGQGDWGPNAKITRFEDKNTFVYALADIAPAYLNNDGVTNSVLSALRTFVYVRPNVVFVHDEMKVAKAAVKKIFNVNFNAASVVLSGDIYSAVKGNSKLFMRVLAPANQTPPTTPIDYNGGTNNVSNYQTTTTGQTSGTFLHLFELAPKTQAAMAGSSYIASSDSREEGAEVTVGSRRWIVMASKSASPVSNATALSYSIPQACPCTHVVTGLMPSTAYQITLTGGSGGTISASSDANAMLTFDTNDAATTGVQIH